ncbi:MAG: T9SS type A sorting domain-containing protein [Ignavibacteriaceae bacterium]
MKQLFSLLFLFVFVSGLSFAQDTFKDEAGVQTSPVVNIQTGDPQWDAPADILYDNGGLVNFPGGGFGGADASVLETALTLTIYGFGAQVSATNSMADDFVVPAPGWQVDEVMLFAYQTGSTTTSTITEVRVQIWDGDPTAGGTIIFGDLTTNRMTNTTWSNIYRSIDTAPLASNRPIMANTASLGVELTPGTYWIQFMFNGTLSSGPWAPPITILNTPTTGNAKQNQNGTWVEALSGTFPQGVPFILMGTEVGGGSTFTDNFDSYVAGQQLACQNPTDWTTWSNLPCDPVEDAYISSNYAYSGANSALFVQNNDVVRLHGSKTTGTWYTSFLFYIPAGKAGYFNQLSGFAPNPNQWAVEVYFDFGGTGRLLNGATVNFTWTENAWNQAVLIVDLDSPTHDAEFLIGTASPLTSVATWDWTRGGTINNQIDANDFFGATALDEMYVDDYYFGDAMPTIIPVELTSFTAVGNNGIVELNWETATEVNNHMFEIERRTEATEFRTIGYVEGAGTTTEPQSYSYTDINVEVGSYVYRLKQIDFNGTYQYSDEVEVDVNAPLSFNLEQNYPNPFNPSTNIKYSVPESGNVKLSVYNLVGEEVAVLVNGNVEAGNFEVTFDASSLPSGVYLYKLQSANSVQTKKMMLLK